MAMRAVEREPDPQLGPMSVEQYLRFEAEAGTKHEYVAGEVYAVSGVSFRHAGIVTNLVMRLGLAVRGGPCRVISVDVKVRAANDRIYYPDVVVVCTPHSGDDLIIGDPCLVIEVTSPSTARTDRTEKLDAYEGMASLRAYLIVDHRRKRVERHWRDEAGAWQREEIIGAGSVPVPCPEMALALEEIYEGVDLPVLREPESPPYEARPPESDLDDDW